VLLACAAPEPLAPGAVRVDVVRAAPVVRVPAGTPPPPIHLVLDVTSSMGSGRTEGVTHLQAARHAAGRFLRSLPSEAELELHVLGTVAGSGCTRAVAVQAPPGVSPGAGLARIADSLPSRSEGSLTAALETIAARLGGEQRGRLGARVVAISDLEGSCAEGDLCSAAAALFSAGADLDLVVIGDAAPPACLAQIGSDRQPPLVGAAEAPQLETTFRVSRDAGREGAPTPLAVGTVGGAALTVEPGRIRVGIDLDPPVEVGPVALAPGGSLWIRILEVPGSEPRRWQVFVEGSSARGDMESAP
jgi:hypothetical protein